MGIARDIAERALNHATQSIEGIYNQYDYIQERRLALTKWANYLYSLEQGALLHDDQEADCGIAMRLNGSITHAVPSVTARQKGVF
jgi:hypothetical protein